MGIDELSMSRSVQQRLVACKAERQVDYTILCDCDSLATPAGSPAASVGNRPKPKQSMTAHWQVRTTRALQTMQVRASSWYMLVGNL